MMEQLRSAKVQVSQDPSTDPGLLDFLLKEADQGKDYEVLAALAQNPALSVKAQGYFRSSKVAKVMVAWLTRPGADEAEILKAASDKRVSVACAVAGRTYLPSEVYGEISSRFGTNAQVQVRLLQNPTTGAEVREQAAVFLLGKDDLNSTLAMEASKALRSYMWANPRGNNTLFKTVKGVVMGRYGEQVVSAPGLNEATLRRFGTELARASKDGRVWMNLPTITTYARYTDVKDAWVSEICSHLGANIAQSVLTARAERPLERAEVSADGMVTEAVRKIIHTTPDLQSRLEAVSETALSTEEFTEVLTQDCWGYTFTVEYTRSKNKNGEIDEVMAKVSEEAGKDAERVAAVVVGVNPDVVSRAKFSADAGAVVRHSVGLIESGKDKDEGSGASWYSANSNDAVRRRRLCLYVQHHGETGAVSALPLWALEVSAEDEWLSELNGEVLRYLWERVGDNGNAWGLLGSFSKDITFKEACETIEMVLQAEGA